MAIEAPGRSFRLVPIEHTPPALTPGDVLIRVAAAGINRADLMQCRGIYPPPPGASELPGLELSGTIMAASGDTANLKPGDRVCALVEGGAYAEIAKARASLCFLIPDHLSFTEAASLPEALFTLWSNLIERGRLASGETVLIHGGTSGIGHLALQIARAFGARVLATVGTESKAKVAESLGASAIHYRNQPLRDQVLALTEGRGVDLILDIIGASYLRAHLDLLKPKGRLVIIGLQGGAQNHMDLLPILQKHLTITGSNLRDQSPQEKDALSEAIKASLWPLVVHGTLRPMIDSTHPLDQANEALSLFSQGLHTGKMVLTMRHPPL